MIDFEIAEKILKANGFVEESKSYPGLHKYRKAYFISGQPQAGASMVVYVDRLKTHAKECISFLGFDWDAEVTKLSTKGLLTRDQEIAVIVGIMPGETIVSRYGRGFNVRFITGEEKTREVLPKTSCSHVWKSYTGLSESFEFCEKCDERRLR